MKNNIYVLNGVLSDYSLGMAVICAQNLTRCREIYSDNFIIGRGSDVYLKQFDRSIEIGTFRVIEDATDQPEGVISCVYAYCSYEELSTDYDKIHGNS